MKNLRYKNVEVQEYSGRRQRRSVPKWNYDLTL